MTYQIPDPGRIYTAPGDLLHRAESHIEDACGYLDASSMGSATASLRSAQQLIRIAQECGCSDRAAQLLLSDVAQLTCELAMMKSAARRGGL